MDMVERSVLAPAAARREVIPNGVDLDVFSPRARAEARSVPLLVFAAQGGRANEFKDFATLRAALGRLSVPVEAVAIGDASPMEEQVGQATVRSLGTVPPRKVADWLRAADVYVHPSRADTFPNGVLEALACGTPVVASRVGGIPEQVTEATGVLVEPGDPAALATAIESLLADPVRRARMGDAAAADARARFAPDPQIDAYIRLYADHASA